MNRSVAGTLALSMGLLAAPVQADQERTWWSVGPVMRWTFGGGGLSLGVEGSINRACISDCQEPGIPRGAVARIEVDGSGATRIALEGQIWALAGLSTGPVVAVHRGAEPDWGWTASLWELAPIAQNGSDLLFLSILELRATRGLPGGWLSLATSAKASAEP